MIKFGGNIGAVKWGSTTISNIYYGHDLVYSGYHKELEYLDYIEGTGTQYIDTGIQGSSELSVIMKLQVINNNASMFFGSRINDEAGDGYAAGIVNTFVTDYNNRITGPFINNYDILEINKEKNITKLLLNENQFVFTDTYKQFSFGYNLMLFTINSSKGVNKNKAFIKLYECKIYYNGILVRHLKPCIYKGEVGMWDEVQGKFYGNQGTDEFIAGPSKQI